MSARDIRRPADDRADRGGPCPRRLRRRPRRRRAGRRAPRPRAGAGRGAAPAADAGGPRAGDGSSSARCRSLARVAGVLLVLAGAGRRRRAVPDLPRRRRHGARHGDRARRRAGRAARPGGRTSRWASCWSRGRVPEVRPGLRRRSPAPWPSASCSSSSTAGSSSTTRPAVEVHRRAAGADQHGRRRGRAGCSACVALVLAVARRRAAPSSPGAARSWRTAARWTRSARRWPAPPSCSASSTVLCLALPAADVPDQLVTDPATGLQTVVTSEGPQALLERPGLALLGGLLLAGAVAALLGRRPLAAAAAGHRRRAARASPSPSWPRR